MKDLVKIERALISVSDKTGIVDLVRVLVGFGTVIVSTGGTARLLRESGIDVTDVADITGFPEMMDGRVKTLHPKIHGGLLALRENREHVSAMKTHGIEPFDMVVVNLYPFERTVEKKDVSLAEAIENIDIGGPSMIRSAAKNWQDVTVITDVSRYQDIAAELEHNTGSISQRTRQHLAAEAFARTAEYDRAISLYLSSKIEEGNSAADDLFPAKSSVSLAKISDLRYGENPHQKAALYSTGSRVGIASAEQLQGKEMSFNNFIDADAAWRLVQDFDDRAVAIIKHTNPSGVGLGETNLEAYERALSTDPVSAFGGIVAFNRPLDAAAARAVSQIFTEVVIAPEIDAEALSIFSAKKNLRLLKVSEGKPVAGQELEYRQISGGMLVQELDVLRVKASDLRIVTEKQPNEEELRALKFAWTVCKHVKSNAIVFANGTQTVGVGAGQMNRVDSVRIAAMRAERFDLPLKGSVLASDAFLPFRDNVDEAAKYGISAIIQPGGSVKDEETIAAADEHGIAMVFTGFRHFKH